MRKTYTTNNFVRIWIHNESEKVEVSINVHVKLGSRELLVQIPDIGVNVGIYTPQDDFLQIEIPKQEIAGELVITIEAPEDTFALHVDNDAKCTVNGNIYQLRMNNVPDFEMN